MGQPPTITSPTTTCTFCGLPYTLPIRCGGYYFFRGGFEAQYWDSFGVDNRFNINAPAAIPNMGANVINTDTGAGFAGFFASVGVVR